MITKLYIKDHLSFKEAELKFKKGLSVFTGVSGAGKSVLMSAILAVFGLSESEARLLEADVDFDFDMSEFGITSEDINSFKMVREKSVRYFINSEFISKKNLNTITSQHIRYLTVRNVDEFENEKLLNLLDTLATKKDKKHKSNLEKLRLNFKEFTEIKKELNKIKEDELKLIELKEFAKFEISKIEEISPKVGEFEELMEIKKKLSKADKINEAWQMADVVFDLESKVVEALNISGIDSSFFEETMNELRFKKDSLNMEELSEIDIEDILNRIESLSYLDRKYGSIKNALEALEIRKKELEGYENIEFTKEELEHKYKELEKSLNEISNLITNSRKSVKELLQNSINGYLKDLYMENINIVFSKKDIDNLGKDSIEFHINNTELKKLSSGELNRLRLAFIASSADITGFGNGVIILDEIDANLSGKEAMSIADVLVRISKYYQIFAISHLPQLGSRANSHFVIKKKDGISVVYELNEEEKIIELARMISGETITNEAIEFAKKLKNI
ncbi:DNA repair protein RecN [Campylobacter blaseri]|uniref:DNA repair protein RecN n=1 Tax=Campylobacter blaseri TaxID=2042961 RepID=A0A2P8R027_9BACT|nr:AAA family ATPase [Campylobacter blaseri]PSM51832.1 DNA recombination protein RecN [Campylobacter blaseri]PSM53623.1 DNA recombination protein RecN [Campylobacter blaseri]QKF86438.1 DNA repair protein RecN [Campylobacter blaseri]